MDTLIGIKIQSIVVCPVIQQVNMSLCGPTYMGEEHGWFNTNGSVYLSPCKEHGYFNRNKNTVSLFVSSHSTRQRVIIWPYMVEEHGWFNTNDQFL